MGPIFVQPTIPTYSYVWLRICRIACSACINHYFLILVVHVLNEVPDKRGADAFYKVLCRDDSDGCACRL